MKETILSTLPLTFVAVVEQGSITRAADELNLAKSAVSQNLKRLEENIGIRLAVRTTRSFNPTPAGDRYYLRCKELLALSKIAASEMESFGANPSGPITVTAPHAMIGPLIAPAIYRLVAKFPDLRPNIIAEDSRLDLIANGVDVAITVGKMKDSSLKARKVGVMRRVLCASSALISSSHGPVSKAAITAVQTLPYIAHAQERSSPVVAHLIGPKGKSPINLSFLPGVEVNTVEALLACTKEGLGVGMLPEYAIRKYVQTGSLVQLFPEYRLEEKSIYAVHAYENRPPKSVLRVIEEVKSQFEQQNTLSAFPQ